MPFMISAVCAARRQNQLQDSRPVEAGPDPRKTAGKKFVVVLPGMHERGFDVGKILQPLIVQLLNDWRDLHEVGPGPHYAEKPDHCDAPEPIGLGISGS
jgi:hypothetical protein